MQRLRHRCGTRGACCPTSWRCAATSASQLSEHQRGGGSGDEHIRPKGNQRMQSRTALRRLCEAEDTRQLPLDPLFLPDLRFTYLPHTQGSNPEVRQSIGREFNGRLRTVYRHFKANLDGSHLIFNVAPREYNGAEYATRCAQQRDGENTVVVDPSPHRLRRELDVPANQSLTNLHFVRSTEPFFLLLGSVADNTLPCVTMEYPSRNHNRKKRLWQPTVDFFNAAHCKLRIGGTVAVWSKDPYMMRFAVHHAQLSQKGAAVGWEIVRSADAVQPLPEVPEDERFPVYAMFLKKVADTPKRIVGKYRVPESWEHPCFSPSLPSEPTAPAKYLTAAAAEERTPSPDYSSKEEGDEDETAGRTPSIGTSA